MGAVPDFTGYATRNGLKCADGRIIMAGAFKGNDGQRVPLVWQHGHDSPENVLGHAILQNVADGVRASAFFNSTSKAQVAKQLVSHGDITQLSIYANQLVQKGPNVHHGNIREVSLVLSGANPGATIDPVSIRHGDDLLQLDDEAIITTGEDFVLSHAITDPEVMKPSTKMPAAGKPTPENPDPDGDKDNDLFDPADGGLDMNTATVADVLNTLTDEQKQVVYALLGAAVDNTQHSGVDGSDNTDGGIDMTGLAHAAGGDVTVAQMLESFTEDQQRTVYALIGAAVEHAQHSGIITGDNNEGDPVARNVFDQSGQGGKTAPSTAEPYVLSHEDVKGLMAAGMKCGSLKFACENFALEHGIESVDVMFPEVKLLQNEPDFQSRRMEWVNGVLTGTRKSPFSRVKTILADITQAEARAKGYVKGNMKDEEFFGVVRRTTTPTTVYKK